MAPPRRFQAPARNGDVFAAPGFDAIPALVEANRRKLDRGDVRIGGLPLRELRARARHEVLEAAREYTSRDRKGAADPVEPLPCGRGSPEAPPPCGRGSPEEPLLLAGHQPELSHPGVWVKNFALNGLARKLGGSPLHLVVDNDTLKSTSLRFPVFRVGDPQSVHLQSVPFDRLDGEVPYEDRPVIDAELFRTFADRAAPLWRNWGFEPLLAKCWDLASGGRKPPDCSRSGGLRPPLAKSIGECLTTLRRHSERNWGCDNLELPVSRLSRIEAFRQFASHLLADLPRFREAYNAAIRTYRAANGIRSANHPAPELGPDEAPFWVRTAPGRRQRATATSDVRNLRPRALTLTLFARVCLGDFFIHGIGGGKYDEVTDAIIRDYFGIEPPACQVLSATLHLPLPGFPGTEDDVKRAERLVRDLHWNPQRHLPPELGREKAALAADESPAGDRAARRAWFRRLHDLTERLRPLVSQQSAEAEAALSRVRAEARANAILKRRDYAWVLYPEEMLRPFLQRFLDQ